MITRGRNLRVHLRVTSMISGLWRPAYFYAFVVIQVFKELPSTLSKDTFLSISVQGAVGAR